MFTVAKRAPPETNFAFTVVTAALSPLTTTTPLVRAKSAAVLKSPCNSVQVSFSL